MCLSAAPAHGVAAAWTMCWREELSFLSSQAGGVGWVVPPPSRGVGRREIRGKKGRLGGRSGGGSGVGCLAHGSHLRPAPGGAPAGERAEGRAKGLYLESRDGPEFDPAAAGSIRKQRREGRGEEGRQAAGISSCWGVGWFCPPCHERAEGRALETRPQSQSRRKRGKERERERTGGSYSRLEAGAACCPPPPLDRGGREKGEGWSSSGGS